MNGIKNDLNESCSSNYPKSSIRSRPSIILDLNFPRLVLEVL